MFTTIVLQTKEVGRIVTHRLPAERGGLGDITATRDGVVISGTFDLNTPEHRAAFHKALKDAEAVIPSLQPGYKEPAIEGEVWTSGAAAAVGGTKVSELTVEDLFEKGTHQPTRMADVLREEEPLEVGNRWIRAGRPFATTVSRNDEHGNQQTYCTFCRKALASSETGWSFDQNTVSSVGVYSPHGEATNPPLVIECGTSPTQGALFTALKEKRIWIHSCANLVSQKFRATFELPVLVMRT